MQKTPPIKQWIGDSGAVMRELIWRDPQIVFSEFAEDDFSLWLDSCDATHEASRYSYICVAPYKTLTVKNGGTDDPFEEIKTELAKSKAVWHGLEKSLDEGIGGAIPPFRGGAAGFFGYDLAHGLDHLSPPESSPKPLPTPDADLTDSMPDCAIGFYDLVLGFDHQHKRCFLFSASPSSEAASPSPDASPESGTGASVKQSVSTRTVSTRTAHAPTRTAQALKRANWLTTKIDALPRQLAQNNDAPFLPLARPIKSDIQADDYIARVQKTIDYIYAGDIFQANLSHRFTATLHAQDSAFDFYKRLRKITPAPFAAFGRFGDMALVSASPERFISCHQGMIETRPIKGTHPRGATKTEDEALKRALQESAKERAENIIIVDLLRSDLSRNCEAGSMTVPDLCRLETFSTVHHLVSTIRARLRAGRGAVDVLKAAFPGGSVSGAPKIRAMEIINELENNPRGAYCGALGYIGFDGAMDTNILIRTAIVQTRHVSFQVGGGITANSNPEAEYLETCDKARGIIAALNGATIVPTNVKARQTTEQTAQRGAS